MKNIPYVKEYDKEKILTNPITKEDPYMHKFMSVPRIKRARKKIVNNKKGVRVIITDLGKGVFTKYKVTTQLAQRAYKVEEPIPQNYVLVEGEEVKKTKMLNPLVRTVNKAYQSRVISKNKLITHYLVL